MCRKLCPEFARNSVDFIITCCFVLCVQIWSILLAFKLEWLMDASIRFRVNAIGQVLGMRKKNRSRINIDDCRAHLTHSEKET